MPDESKTASTFDPVDVWRQWYDNATKVWTNTLGGSKEAYVDPFGVYRMWLKSSDVREDHGQPAAPPTIDPLTLWKDWFNATSSMWRKTAEAGPVDPLGLTTQWLEMMEETRAKLLSKEGLPLDPLSFFREWYDRSSETWSTVIGDVIGTEAFMESASRYMEVYTGYYKTLRQTAETQLHNLQIPTRSDVARVAGLVVALEDKVDSLEDAFERLEDAQAAAVDGATLLSSLEERVARLETKLDTLIAAVERLGANGHETARERARERTQAQKANGAESARRAPPRRTRRTPPRTAGE